MTRLARGLPSIALVLTAGCLMAGREGATEHIQEDGAVLRVDIEVDAGRVEIVGKESRVGAVGTAKSRWSDVAPEVVHYVDDGVLHVLGRCEILAGPCLVDVTLEVPAGTNVSIDAGRGDVTVRGVDGDVEVSTGSGGITLGDLSGSVFVESGDGEIVGETLSGALVDGRTGDGDVTLSLLEPAQRLVGRTEAGDVALVVPAGTYRVETDAPKGEVSITANVREDPASNIVIIAGSGSGDVAIVGRTQKRP